jgi:iron complex outermembrane receptor protein
VKLQIRHAVMLAIATAAPAAALAQSADNGTIEEVVITAQKRTEKLSDVPVAASVVSSETISKLNAGDISDINRLVPSVQLNGTINGRVPLGVRGISSVSNEGTVGLASGVAILIDGVPVPSDSRAANALEDVTSVEVLKGPQATLFGRAAAQGVINIVTHDPSDKLEGKINLMATDDSEYRVNGYVSGPLSSTVKGSLAAYYTTRDFPIVNLRTHEATSEKVAGVRGKLLIQPNDKLDIKLVGRLGQDDSRGANFVYVHTSPGAALLLGTGGHPPFLDQSVLLPGYTPGWDNRYYSSPKTVYSNVDDDEASVEVAYRLPGATITSTTAYQHESQANQQDLFIVDNYFFNLLTGAPCNADGTGAIPCFDNEQSQSYQIKQLSEELKIASTGDGNFNYVAGLFYSDQDITLQALRTLAPAWLDRSTNSRTRTTALYGRTTYKFNPSWQLVTGLRLNNDQISYHAQDTILGPPVAMNAASSSESTVVGDASLQYKYGPNAMSYVTYARGYAPAAYNTAQDYAQDPNASPIPPLTALPFSRAAKEDIDHLELGTKGSYLDGRLTFNLAAFLTQYKNFQVQIFDQSSSSIAPPLVLSNAGKAITKGVEIDGAFAATKTLRIDYSLALINAYFDDYKGAPCYYPDTSGLVPPGCTQAAPINNIVQPVKQNLSGQTMPNSPKIKLVIGAEQRFPINGTWDLLAAGNYSWRDKAQMLVDQNPYGVQAAFGTLNVSLGLRDNEGKRSITVFCNNCTNEHYFTDIEDFWSAPWGGTNNIVGQPARDFNRYFGVRLSVGF